MFPVTPSPPLSLPSLAPLIPGPRGHPERSEALPSKAGPLSSDLCLVGSTPSASYEEEELPPDPSEETLTIEARFQPLLPESMTKSKDGFLGVSWGRGGRRPPHAGPEAGTICVQSRPENGSVLCFHSFFPSFLYQPPSVAQWARLWGSRSGCHALLAVLTHDLVGEVGGMNMSP